MASPSPPSTNADGVAREDTEKPRDSREKRAAPFHATRHAWRGKS